MSARQDIVSRVQFGMTGNFAYQSTPVDVGVRYMETLCHVGLLSVACASVVTYFHRPMTSMGRRLTPAPHGYLQASAS